MKYKSLKVFPDFNSSGIWNNRTGIMVSLDSLPISTELKEAFEKWIYFYDDHCTSKKTYCVLKSKEQILNKKGRDLARRLKKELPGTEIRYLPEYSYRTVPKKVT